MRGTLMRAQLLVLAGLCAACSVAAGYSSDPGRSVIRTVNMTSQLVDEPITVTAMLTNTGSSDVHGFYYADHLHPDLEVSTVSVIVDEVETTGYTYEVGFIDEVYAGSVTHRWVIETPPEFSENLPVASTCVIVYTVSSATELYYTLPGYTWAGRDVFGYETDPPALDFVLPDSGTGAVHVDVTPDSAEWTVTDGDGGTHSGSGDITLTEVPVGTVSIGYMPLPGYDAPASVSDTLVDDGTVGFTGLYTRHMGTVVIEVTPDTASWSFVDGDGAAHSGSGDTMVIGIPAGRITVTWSDLSGWLVPDPNSATRVLAKDGTATFEGEYMQVVGTIRVNVIPDELDASWQLDGPDGYTYSGTGAAELTDRVPGEYTIYWDAAERWARPTPDQVTETLAADASLTFSGTYVRHTGSVVVDVEPDTAPWSFIDGDSAEHSGVGDRSITGVPTGAIELTWGDLAGHNTPTPNPVAQNLTEDATVTFVDVYVRHTGTIVVEVTPDSASWTVTDGDGATHSGTGDAALTEVPAGTVSIEYAGMTGYGTPPDDSGLLADGGTVTFSVTYVSAAPVDVDLNGTVDAVDIQLVINDVLGLDTDWDCDTNCDGSVDAVDIQIVINAALGLDISHMLSQCEEQ